MFSKLRNFQFTLKHFAMLGVFAIFGFTFMYVSVEMSSASSFCGTACHEMNPEYESWQNSAHKNVECAECHEKPGLAGTIESKAQGTMETIAHITGNYDTPIVMEHPEKIDCYSCHQDKIKTNTEVAYERKDPHTMKHFENGLNCITCHAGVVHNEQANNTLPTRDRCYTCHLDDMSKLTNKTNVQMSYAKTEAARTLNGVIVK